MLVPVGNSTLLQLQQYLCLPSCKTWPHLLSYQIAHFHFLLFLRNLMSFPNTNFQMVSDRSLKLLLMTGAREARTKRVSSSFIISTLKIIGPSINYILSLPIFLYSSHNPHNTCCYFYKCGMTLIKSTYLIQGHKTKRYRSSTDAQLCVTPTF
jgi:hypothetical protein